MSWRWRAFNRARMLVDRIYLTAIFWGPWRILRVVIPFCLGTFFLLKMLGVICPATWVTTLCLVTLLADAAYSVRLGCQLIAAGSPRDSSEAPPPP